MKISSLLLVAASMSLASAYMIAAPVYAVKRNIDGKPRAMRAREELLRRRLMGRSQLQKAIQDTADVFSDFREENTRLDLCEVSDCELRDWTKGNGFQDDSNDDWDVDGDEDLYFTGPSLSLPSWVRVPCPICNQNHINV